MRVMLKKREEALSSADLASGYSVKYWWPEIRLDLDLTGIVADFYLFYAVKDGSPYLQGKFEDYASVIAKQFAVYLDASIGGELRHSKKKVAGLPQSSRSLARKAWRRRRLTNGITELEAGRDNFLNGKWSTSYGGKAWAAITDLLIKHLTGEVSTIMFVDQAFALQHNTSTVFNKLASYWTQGDLKTVLDANLNQDWVTLLHYASPWAKTMFLSWLEDEEKVAVEGVKNSRPRIVERNDYTASDGQSLSVGQRVRVSKRSRSKKWQGKEGKISKINIYPKAMVQLDDEGKSRTLNQSSLRALQGVSEIETGARVQVRQNAHSTSIRGKKGVVVKAWVSVEVEVIIDEAVAMLNMSTLDVLDNSLGSYLEYIGGE